MPVDGGACSQCLRRSWLLAQLNGPLEFCARDRERLLAVLALGDGELIDALGGRRRAELTATYGDFRPRDAPADVGLGSICSHHPGYPGRLRGPAAPSMLSVAGGVGRMARLTAAPAVAILGSAAASDYGMEAARGLARGLAASGVTVVSILGDGVAVAAHAGALEAGGATLAVMGSGLGVSPPVRRRGMLDRIRREGCAISELAPDCGGRRWGALASERIPAELAQLSIVVEAEENAGDLFAPRIARSLGRAVAAVPGRVSSPLSRGTHALLMDGASLVRDSQDALELLYAGEMSTTQTVTRPLSEQGDVALEPRLLAVFEAVGAGADTPGKLTRRGGDHGETLLALSELELMGLLARGDGGRYVPRSPPPRTSARSGRARR
jgi:DNA processing protein